MEVLIREYSDNSRHKEVAETLNVSSIIDKLIRLSAKLTESYAGDIVYHINALKESVEQRRPMDVLLFFREQGVTMRQTACMTDAYNLSEESLQTWRLKVEPMPNSINCLKTTLVRVRLAHCSYA